MRNAKSSLVLLVIALTSGGMAEGAVVSTFQWTDTFTIYGHRPIPQVNGFDYWFSTEQIDTSLRGATVRIDSVRLFAPSTNIGNVINWDMEVFLHGEAIGMPEGQFIQTHTDPVTGYNKESDTEFHVVVGAEVTTNSYDFDVQHDYNTNVTSAYPYYIGRAMKRSDIVLTDGLHAKLFFWTGDNRNCHIEFDGATLEVNATVLSAPVPEPTCALLWLGLFATGAVVAGRRLKT